ncbi:hypothetical protein [Erwinia mallotivora]|uniref:hypothetical protein n=1 Tax=Erwinia mallotivora TaxID=69222 RepID=UPI0021BEDE40|nr:hypothetical protein [Erwinia mallotivora]
MDGTVRDYYESAENMAMTRKRALKELRRHHLDTPKDVAEFYADLGDRDIYQAQAVLRWLGY